MNLKPIQKIYLMNSIYGLAGSFVGIFVPIYFLSRGASVSSIIWYYIVYTIGVLVFFFLADWLSQKFGLRKTVILGFPVLFVYLFLIYSYDRYNTNILFISAVSSLQAGLYWFPLHIWLTNALERKSEGGGLGRFFAFSRLVGLFSPLIASIIALTFGFKALFIIAACLYAVSLAPLLMLPEYPYAISVKFSDFLRLAKSYPHYVWAEIIENIREDAEGIIWPIFVFLSFKNILSVGYIGTIAGLGVIIFDLIIGHHADKGDKQKLMFAGVLILTSIWIIRLFVHDEYIFYTLSLLVGFCEALILIPLNSVVYSVAKREGGATFILFREFLVAGGRLVLYAFALLVVSNIKYIFVIPAISGLYFLYVARKDLDGKTKKI